MSGFQTAMFIIGCVFTALSVAGGLFCAVAALTAKLRPDLEPETLGSAYTKGYAKGRADADAELLAATFDEAQSYHLALFAPRNEAAAGRSQTSRKDSAT